MGVFDVYFGEVGFLGGECIGEVIELGVEVKDFKVGDWVMLFFIEFCMSIQMLLEELLICCVLNNFFINEVLIILVVYCMALYGLKNFVKLKKGEWVLIYVGVGGVGLVAIYIVRYLGVEVFVIVSEKKCDYLCKIGVEYVFDLCLLDFV